MLNQIQLLLNKKHNNTKIIGNVDKFDPENSELQGWLFNKKKANTPVSFFIELNGEIIKECIADVFRQDLQKLGYGHGQHGFSEKIQLNTNCEYNCIRLLDKHKQEISNTSTNIHINDIYPRSTIIGNIESFNTDTLTGWLYDEKEPNKTIYFFIAINSQTINESKANVFRKDLQDAGIGNGKHGFNTKINLDPKNEPININILDMNKKLILTKSFKPNQGLNEKNIKLIKREPYQLVFEISDHILHNDKTLNDIVYLYCDDALCLKRKLKDILIPPYLYIPLPICQFDGKRHELSLGIDSHPKHLWRDNLQLKNSNRQIVSEIIFTNKTILFIDAKIPSIGEDAGSYAAIQEIKLMQALGYDVAFIAENFLFPAKKIINTLKQLNVIPIYPSIYIPYERFILFALENYLPYISAVYITRYNVAEKIVSPIKLINSKMPIIINNADLHFLRQLRLALNKNNTQEIEQALKTQKSELETLSKANAILTYSDIEKSILISHLHKSDNIHICPWVLPEKETPTPFSNRDGIAFLGGYKHQPNIEALDYFIQEISPLLLKADQNIICYIYGSHLPEKYENLSLPNIRFIGFIEKLDDLYHKHKIFISPLASGAGIKGKVLDAIAYGLPTILTPIAAEGIGLSQGINTLLAEEPKEWVQQIIRLYYDKTLWQEISINQQKLAKDKFSFSEGKNKMGKILDSLGL